MHAKYDVIDVNTRFHTQWCSSFHTNKIYLYFYPSYSSYSSPGLKLLKNKQKYKHVVSVTTQGHIVNKIKITSQIYFVSDYIFCVFVLDHVKHVELSCLWKMLLFHIVLLINTVNNISYNIIHFSTGQYSVIPSCAKIYNKEFNNILYQPCDLKLFFLCSLCLNFHFLEVYTDASVVLRACKWSIKYSITMTMWEKGSGTASVIHTASRMWLCSHVSEPNSDSAVKLKCLHLYGGQLERKWLFRSFLRNQWGLSQLLLTPNESMNSGGQQRALSFEDQYTYAEWCPKLWRLTGPGS